MTPPKRVRISDRATTSIVVRGVTYGTVRALTAAAQADGRSRETYLRRLLDDHAAELRRKGASGRS